MDAPNNAGGQQCRPWIACIPEEVKFINDISNEAVWTLSSCKGF
jgi:hypothetical protein